MYIPNLLVISFSAFLLTERVSANVCPPLYVTLGQACHQEGNFGCGNDHHDNVVGASSMLGTIYLTMIEHS